VYVGLRQNKTHEKEVVLVIEEHNNNLQLIVWTQKLNLYIFLDLASKPWGPPLTAVAIVVNYSKLPPAV